ncbi:Abi family protein [Desulfosporosinus nitroreducens]|uniref:Abi family protein n=1 Tax=Desulfosporosinus nitroreducens TaxID=2018668 RepID=UPI00207C6C01|nr:Abi family protein [Desulfosporosinus nitroreducens]MCO1604029.1 Abi family protein [Desulfosporosinus nitroreducens]
MEKAVKDPTTYQEQISILKSRGMGIPVDSQAEDVLKRVNYYRLSAYMLTLKENNKFYDGVTFEDVYHIYEFDKRLRNMIIEVLEGIEIAFRTHIAYELAHKYGPLSYQDSVCFRDLTYHQEMLKCIQQDVDQRQDELFIRHHIHKYDGNFPIWVVIEVMSFGQLSKMFKNLKSEDQKLIADKYYNSIPYTFIQNWLYVFSNVRNICAHYGRLYDRNLKIKPRLYKAFADKFPDNKIFSVMYVMGKLCLNKVEWRAFVNNLVGLVEQYEGVDLERLGFPKEWYNELRLLT